ncbi:MAG: hypothetical protein ACK5MA_07550 [Parachlamydiaceae bacterium]
MFFPLAAHEVERLTARIPHPDYWKISSRGGRKCSALTFVKDALLLPFKIPVYACFNLILMCQKIGQLAICLFSSIRSPEKWHQLKRQAITLADYFFLIFITPAFRIVRIAKLLIGATIYPGICYVKPEEEELRLLDSFSSEESGEVVDTDLNEEEDLDLEEMETQSL